MDAVFMDKDGTLITDVPYNADPGRIRLEPGALVAMRLLHQVGLPVILVSNQSGVAMGRFQEEDLNGVHQRIDQLLMPEGVQLHGFFHCPHHPHALLPRYRVACRCRKPLPGLLLRAAEELGIRLSGSWMVGDILDDVEAGRRAGCTTVLLDNGHETEWLLTPNRVPHVVVPTLEQAARCIVAQRLVCGRSET